MIIKEIVQYRGNSNYFCCYCKDENDKNFVLFAKIQGVLFESECGQEYEDFDIPLRIITPPMNRSFKLPLCENYYVVNVDDFKDYELINRILEVIWMKDN
jgi:hypothetical protein